jgi:hypothetical protein
VRRWILFFLISNLLLFLPTWFVFREQGSLLPFGGIQNVQAEGLSSILFLNHNYNPFRLAAEWSLLLLLLMVIGVRSSWRRPLAGLVAGIWLFLFAFQLYAAVMQGLYGTYPQWTHEWTLIREVVPVFLAGMNLSFPLFVAGLGLGLLLLLFGLYRVMLFVWKDLPAGRAGPVVLAGTGLVALFLLASGWRYQSADRYDYRLNVQWLAPRIAHAILSPDIRRLDNLALRQVPYQAYSTLHLQDPPNIYLIFLESYGSVAHLSPYIGEQMQDYLDSLETALTSEGWQFNSQWSVAPIKGGRSWLSFTSAIAGLPIANQVAYNDLIENHAEFPHLVRFLNTMGYRTHRINTMQTNEETERLIPYAQTGRFFDFDTWTHFQDIPYRGYRYHPMGGLPDQYALEFVHERHIRDQPGPHFLFFITLDGHAPWYPPPPVVERYRMLDSIIVSPYGKDWNLEADIMDRYRDAMRYQLDMATRFIRKNGRDNDLCILIGDHQPPAMEWQVEGRIEDAAVPLHIIHRNASLGGTLEALGFPSGLRPSLGEPVWMRHEGVYSLIAHLLSGHYGSKEVPVIFRPSGI